MKYHKLKYKNDQTRKGLISNLTRLVLNHPENKKLMDETFVINDGTRVLPVRTSICTNVQKSTSSKPRSPVHLFMI